jgi:hypothetical protein
VLMVSWQLSALALFLARSTLVSSFVRPLFIMPKGCKRSITTIGSDMISKSPVSNPKKARTKKAAQAEEQGEQLDRESGDEKNLAKKEYLNQRIAHSRDLIEPRPLNVDHKYAKIMTWNVNGFKALASNKLTMFINLVDKHQPDIICLQETKLQECAVDEYRGILEGYNSHWHCSSAKKGYSGTVRNDYCLYRCSMLMSCHCERRCS